MSSLTPAPSFSLTISTATRPEYTTNYSTTYIIESPLPGPPGEGGGYSTSTVTTEWIATVPSTTITSTIIVPIVTSMTPPASSSTAPSTLITSTTSLSTASGSSGTNFIGPISTTSSVPSGITPIQKSNTSNTIAITLGVMVPLIVISIVVIVFVLWKWKQREIAFDRAAGRFNIKHRYDQPETESPTSAFPHPPPPPPPPTTESKAELRVDREEFRVTSPQRPIRPSSITSSVLNVIDESTSGSIVAEASSIHGVTGIELELLRSPKSFSDDDEIRFVPNTDSTPVFDGTRNRYLRAALEHNIPLDRLNLTSLHDPEKAHFPPRTNGLRRMSNIPEPLCIRKEYEFDSAHKRSVSDVHGSSARSRYVTNVQDGEKEQLSLNPSEQDFITEVRRAFSKTPPIEKAAEKHKNLMVDGNLYEGSFIQENEIVQKRKESLASLEGRTPEVGSFDFGRLTSRPEERHAFGRPIPPRAREIDPEQAKAGRKQGNTKDKGKVNSWI